MKIKELTIKGFRSLKDVTWKPGDLNVIIGPNASGKSNLLQALELLGVSAHQRLGKYVRSRGGMESLQFDGQKDAVTFSFRASPPGGLYAQQEMSYYLELFRVGSSSAYIIDEEILVSHIAAKDGSDSGNMVSHIRRGSGGGVLFHDQGIRSVIPVEVATAEEIPLEIISQEETSLRQAAAQFVSDRSIPMFHKQLESWVVYHDVRVDRDSKVRESFMTEFGHEVEPDGQNFLAVLHTLHEGDKEFKRAVHDGMHAAFGGALDGLSFPPAADGRTQFRVAWNGLKKSIPASYLSDGTLRFLFLMTVLANPNPPSLIAIDEPETGLHPSMLPIVAEFAVDASERTQVIFTTHSDQFLNAFYDTKPTTTVAKAEEGATSFNVVAKEELEYWLKHYSLGELYRSGELEAMA